MEYSFLLQSTTAESAPFPTKLPCQKPVLRQIDWKV